MINIKVKQTLISHRHVSRLGGDSSPISHMHTSLDGLRRLKVLSLFSSKRYLNWPSYTFAVYYVKIVV
jgi:hypothetical protein